jgi:uncharacterized protein with HEPN domain
MVVIFCGLLVFGQYRLLRKKGLIGWILFSVITAYFAALILTGPLGVQLPVVVSRYAIVVFPLSFVLAAFGMDSVLSYFESFGFIKGRRRAFVLTNIIITAFLAALFFLGPLLRTYSRPNNFTNHWVFQTSYEPVNWERIYTSDQSPPDYIKRTSIPDFYYRLAERSDVKTVIEYPMEIVGDFNFHYYYQHFHKKDVIVGYAANLDTSQYSVSAKFFEAGYDSFLVSGWYVDHILSRMPDAGKFKFRNLIDMTNIAAIRRSGADYIILHKNLKAELDPNLVTSEMPVYMPVLQLVQLYRKSFGEVFFEDKNIVVFGIQ